MRVAPNMVETLKARAGKLATRKKTQKVREDVDGYTVFVAGSERFAIPTRFFSFVVRTPVVVGMPHLTPWFRGIAQVRGNLVAIVDLAAWLGVPKRTTGTFTLVVEGEPGKLGLLVDHVIGFRDIGASDFAETFSDSSTTATHPIRAITKDLTALLDMKKLFSNPDMVIDFKPSPVAENGGSEVDP